MAESQAHRPSDIFTGLAPISQASLAAALQMWATPRVSALLAVRVPEDPARWCDMALLTGPVVLSVDTSKMAPRK